jgi:hypothetical protein
VFVGIAVFFAYLMMLLVNSELEKMWKEMAMVNLEYYLEVCSEG